MTASPAYMPEARQEATEDHDGGPPLGRAASSALELASLQGRLFLADLRSCLASVRVSAVFAAITLALLIAAFPLFLIAGAMGLRDATGMPTYAAFAAVAGVASLVAAIFGYAAYRMSREGLALLSRSYAEMEANLKSIAPGGSSDAGRPNTPS